MANRHKVVHGKIDFVTPNNPFRTSIWFSTFSFWLSLLLWWGITAIQALPYGAGTYGSCQYQSCSISVLSSGTVALNATPTVSGVYTFASDNVTVDTAASTGYTLTLKDSDTTTSLQNGADTITATSGTPASRGGGGQQPSASKLANYQFSRKSA
jgi:hypothetical protein